MTKVYGLVPTEENYVSLLHVYTITCTGHNNENNKRAFYDVLDQFMEDVLVPEKASWDALRRWFEKENAKILIGDKIVKNETGTDIDTYIIEESKVSGSGRVRSNGQYLHSIDMDSATRAVLLDQVEALASARVNTITNAAKQVQVSLDFGVIMQDIYLLVVSCFM